MQFDILKTDFSESDNGSSVKVRILFRRKVSYHLSNTFAPTVSLLAIVEITLFFEESRLDMAVTLSLTVLLVIYTFYQSISAAIPQTAYLKLIDYWLIFCLLVPFVIFIVESASYLDRSRQSKIENQRTGIKKLAKSNFQENIFKRRIVPLTIVAFSFAFIFAYFAFAWYIFNEH